MDQIIVPRPDALQVAKQRRPIRSYTGYASHDFNSLRDRFIQYAKDNYGEQFNDIIQSDYGIMLIELLAHGIDLMSFKLDMLFNESFMTTARLRQSVVKIAKTLGYTPHGVTCAQAQFIVSVLSPYTADITIPTAIAVQRTDANGELLRFELYPKGADGLPNESGSIIISAGSTSNSNIVGVEGATIYENFSSTGEPNQSFAILEDNFSDSWLRVRVDGVLWTRETVLYGLVNNYILDNDQFGKWSIVFGDGTDGAIPPQGAQIDVSYRRGGGSRGNIISNFFNEIINVPVGSISVPIQIVNYEPGSGGAEEESIEEIRRNAIVIFRAQDRAVTASDYDALAEYYFRQIGVGSVKVRTALRHSGCSANIVDVYALKVAGYDTMLPLSEDEKALFEAWVKDRCVLTDVVAMRDGAVVQFDIVINAKVQRAFNRSISLIENAVRTRLSSFFSIQNWSIGQNVNKNDVVKALSGIADVVSVGVYMKAIGGLDRVNQDGDLVVNYWEIARPTRNVQISVSLAD